MTNAPQVIVRVVEDVPTEGRYTTYVGPFVTASEVGRYLEFLAEHYPRAEAYVEHMYPHQLNMPEAAHG